MKHNKFIFSVNLLTDRMKHLYFKIYKPYGYISQFSSNQAKSHRKRFLGQLHDFPKGVMAVGRLDEKSEGLLLLTTNGKKSNEINRSGIEKEYYVQVDGLITSTALDRLSSGVEISIESKIYLTKPAQAIEIPTPILPETIQKIRDERHGPSSWISITITEGKFRQVRKMTAAVDFPTLRLVRVRVGNIRVDSLKPGSVVQLKEFNIM